MRYGVPGLPGQAHDPTRRLDTRAGFAKFTSKDAYTAEKGYGFESSQGLVAKRVDSDYPNQLRSSN